MSLLESLYELPEQYMELQEKAMDPGYTKEDLDFAIQSLQGALEDKADYTARVIRNLEANSSAIDEEIKRLQERKKKEMESITELKDSLKGAMLTMNKTYIKTPFFTLKTKNTAPSLVIDVKEDVPEEFYAPPVPSKPKIDNAKLKEYLKGNSVPYAHLEPGYSLTIQ